MKHILRNRLMPLVRQAAATAALSLVCLGAQAMSVVVNQGEAEEQAQGELVADLMFHADLLSMLDKLCPARAPARDWRAVIHTMPASAREPELVDLSRRLSTDAAKAMLKGSGGCGTRHFTEAYTQTRLEYEGLLEQWVLLGA